MAVKKSELQHLAEYYKKQPQKYRMGWWKWMLDYHKGNYEAMVKLVKEKDEDVLWAIDFWRPK